MRPVADASTYRIYRLATAVEEAEILGITPDAVRSIAPCGNVALLVIDGVWRCLLTRPPEKDMGHCKERLGLSKATWGNLTATRYRLRWGTLRRIPPRRRREGTASW